MREQKTKAQAKKINNDIIPTPCSHQHHLPTNHEIFILHLRSGVGP